MNSVLFFVDVSASPDHNENQKWQVFLNACRDMLATSLDTKRLSENCWQIPLQSELYVFAHLASEAKKVQLPCRSLFFENVPSWVVS